MTASESAAKYTDPQPQPPAYALASMQQLRVSTEFVNGVCAYEAISEPKAAFLNRVAGLVTPSELTRLRRSDRAHLNWPALRARREQVRVRVNGVSQAGSADHVVVELLRTTRTDFVTVRSFERLELHLAETADGPLVADAEGACS
ncbi:hypothetical protein [Nocardioides korecus]